MEKPNSRKNGESGFVGPKTSSKKQYSGAKLHFSPSELEVIYEWRGVKPTLPPVEKWFTPSESLRPIMEELKAVERLDYHAIQSSWAQIAGDMIARCATPVAYQKGILTIRVLNPSLRFELERFAMPQILSKLRQALPQIKIQKIGFTTS